MEYIFNGKKIDAMLSDFYIATGIAVTFYDATMARVATSPEHSPYCMCIRSKRECLKNCNKSNLAHMEKARATKQTVSYTCHAGLMETIMPVFYEDTLIGYMQIGQFKDSEARYSSKEIATTALNSYGIRDDKILSLYEDLPTVSEKKLSALKEILFVLIKNFWEEGLIRHNRSMLSVKIEQYVLLHIKEKITVETLCSQFFISKNALYRIFSSEFGMTVNEYVMAKRIQIAIKLLKDTDETITSIAADCGIPDYNYFIRAFKKHMGISPLQYRKSN
ncbi:MAG: PocR ligand-binding domain-containing protein [Clostridia bacterium]|nr:PocR ligand-binding domain-containing protein [Clostridia bacterium]